MTPQRIVFSFCSLPLLLSSHSRWIQLSGWKSAADKEKEREIVRHQWLVSHSVLAAAERKRGSGGATLSSLTPGSKFTGSQADFLGLDTALMTGLRPGDAGPTGDLQVLVDEPEPDSLLLQVGLKTYKVLWSWMQRLGRGLWQAWLRWC